MRTYTFRIKENIFKQLKAIAKKEERKVSQLVRIAISELITKYKKGG
ncbi:ribbon-helix-helix domain-containing protein [bacterium]|nr:ribbon-helix-helix domain-containing protein [bacterium]